jgi:CRP-like cAMP-binding protein
MGSKECFGEMPLLTGESRSAGVQAVTELSALKLSRERFDNLLIKHHSLAIYFAGVLAKRLASAHRDLTYCKELIAKEGKLEGQRAKPRSSQMAQSILNKPLLTIIVAGLLCSL